MYHDEIPAYSVESLKEHARQIRDIATRMDADEVDEALAEVEARIGSSEGARHPGFDLDVPDTEDVWHAWSNADEARDAESLEELADMMDATADSLRKINADAQATHDEDTAERQRDADAAEAIVRVEAASRGLTEAETDDLLIALRYNRQFGLMYSGIVSVERARAVMDIFKEMSRDGASTQFRVAVVTQLDLTTDRSEELAAARHVRWADELAAAMLGIELVSLQPTPWSV